MWTYVILAIVWAAIIFKWLVPVIRKRIACEIYEAIGLGGFFTLLVLGIGGQLSYHHILSLRIIGFILYLPAAFFVFSAFANLKGRGKPENGWEETTVVIDQGIFRLVRHPLYLGTAIWTVAVIFLFPSVSSIILGVACIFCFGMASRKEDRFNLEKFGEPYRRYMQKVPRWNFFQTLGRR